MEVNKLAEHHGEVAAIKNYTDVTSKVLQKASWQLTMPLGNVL